MTQSSNNDLQTQPTITAAEHAAATARVEKLARVLDDWVTIPGINYKVGIDSVIGLVPVVGDVTSAVLGAYMVYEGHRLGAPKGTLGKMAGNVGADLLVGLIPGVGDVADFVFKSNRRNLKLLKAHVDSLAPAPEDPPAGPGRWVVRVIVLGGLAIAGVGLLAWLA